MAYVCHGPWTYTYFMIFIFNNFSKLILMFICADELIESHATATEVNLRCWTHKYLSNIIYECVRACVCASMYCRCHLAFVGDISFTVCLLCQAFGVSYIGLCFVRKFRPKAGDGKARISFTLLQLCAWKCLE